MNPLIRIELFKQLRYHTPIYKPVAGVVFQQCCVRKQDKKAGIERLIKVLIFCMEYMVRYMVVSGTPSDTCDVSVVSCQHFTTSLRPGKIENNCLVVDLKGGILRAGSSDERCLMKKQLGPWPVVVRLLVQKLFGPSKVEDLHTMFFQCETSFFVVKQHGKPVVNHSFREFQAARSVSKFNNGFDGVFQTTFGSRKSSVLTLTLMARLDMPRAMFLSRKMFTGDLFVVPVLIDIWWLVDTQCCSC